MLYIHVSPSRWNIWERERGGGGVVLYIHANEEASTACFHSTPFSCLSFKSLLCFSSSCKQQTWTTQADTLPLSLIPNRMFCISCWFNIFLPQGISNLLPSSTRLSGVLGRQLQQLLFHRGSIDGVHKQLLVLKWANWQRTRWSTLSYRQRLLKRMVYGSKLLRNIYYAWAHKTC